MEGDGKERARDGKETRGKEDKEGSERGGGGGGKEGEGGCMETGWRACESAFSRNRTRGMCKVPLSPLLGCLDHPPPCSHCQQSSGDVLCLSIFVSLNLLPA